MNLFSTLPIPDELQLRLSEVVTTVTPYYSSGTWTPVVESEEGIIATVVRKSYIRLGAGPSAASGDFVFLDLVINFSCDDAGLTPGCAITLPPGFTIGPAGATALINAVDLGDGSIYAASCDAGESIPGSLELYLDPVTLSDIDISAKIRVVYFVA